MKESKFLGALLLSSPDFIPMIEAVREKYNLPEITSNHNPNSEIYPGMRQQKVLRENGGLFVFCLV